MPIAFKVAVALSTLASGALAVPPLIADPARANPPEAPPPAFSATASEWRGMSIDELIAALPPTGGERRWDRESGQSVEHPASAEMTRRLRLGAVLTDEQWRVALTRTGALRVRTRWPTDSPFAVSMDVPGWLGISQIRATPRGRPLKSAVAGELVWSFSGTMPMIRAQAARYQELGRLEPGRHQLVFDVVVERGRGSPFDEDDLEPGVLWRGTIEYKVEVVDSVENAIPAAAGEALDAAVRHALGAGIRNWGSSRTVYVVIDPDVSLHPELAYTGLSLRIEALRDGEVIDTGAVVASRLDRLALMNSVSSAPLRFYGSFNLNKVAVGLDANPDELARWSLRVRGTSDYLLSIWEATQRWGGEMTIPLADAIRNEQQRTGPRGRGPEVSTPRMR